MLNVFILKTFTREPKRKITNFPIVSKIFMYLTNSSSDLS